MKIAWVGDSITVGTSPIVRERLRSLGSSIEIVTLAKVGAPLPWMAGQRVPDDVDVVVLAGGTNDLVGASAEEAFKRLKETRATLEAQGKKVLVSTIPPSKARGDKTDAYNALIRSLPSGEHLETGGALSLSDISSDGVHPSMDGYRKLAGLYTEKLLALEDVVPEWAWVVGGLAVVATTGIVVWKLRTKRLKGKRS